MPNLHDCAPGSSSAGPLQGFLAGLAQVERAEFADVVNFEHLLRCAQPMSQLGQQRT